MEKRHGIPKDEVKAMRKEGVYKRKVMTANFGQELIAQSLSQEAKEAASKI